MSTVEQKKIVIRLPRIEWKWFLNVRAAFVLILLLCAGALFYWHSNIRPFVWISHAHVEMISAEVGSDQEGRLVGVGPFEGEFVKKGQTLFAVDHDFLLAKQKQMLQLIQELRSKVEAEKANMEKVMQEYLASTENGANSQNMSQLQVVKLENAQIRSEDAEKKLMAANESLLLLEKEAEKLIYTAPFAGVVLKRSKQQGAFVASGDPVLVLGDPNQIWVEGDVPEALLSRISLGTPARIRLAAYPEQEWVGKISWIGPAARGDAPTIPIKVSLEQKEIVLRPGLSAEIGLKVR